MDNSDITAISLCSGVGMLDLGAALGFERLGRRLRTVAYVEREAFACSQLVALIEAGCLDAAPIFHDVTRFPGRRFRGAVDCVIAGFPCQPHSHAGKREGVEDERWVWPDIARVVGDVGPDVVYLENVTGLVTSGGLDACLGDLASLGFDAEWGCVSAAGVGASHERDRIFILAYTSGARLQGNELGEALDGDGRGPEAHGSATELRRLFAPGPSDQSWEGYCAYFPHIAPAIESGVCFLADGVALVVDESRTDQLRAIGNGVVPTTAASALVQLARRAMKANAITQQEAA